MTKTKNTKHYIVAAIALLLLVAAIGWKIKRVSPDSEEVSQTAIAEVDEP